MSDKSNLQWFELVTMSDGKIALDIETEQGQQPAIVTSNFFNEQGEPVLMSVCLPMEGLAPQQVRQYQMVIEANFQKPTLIVDSRIKLVRLKPISDARAKHILESNRIATREMTEATNEKEEN
jgi:hypothetical protein